MLRNKQEPTSTLDAPSASIDWSIYSSLFPTVLGIGTRTPGSDHTGSTVPAISHSLRITNFNSIHKWMQRSNSRKHDSILWLICDQLLKRHSETFEK
jgi:hypothetical protein